MSNAERRSKFPDAPMPAAVPGNLLSSIAPPSHLPNFAITTTPIPPEMLPPTQVASSVVSPIVPQPKVPPPMVPEPVAPPPTPVVPLPTQAEPPQPMDNFSPAIPLSKGEPMLPIRSPEGSQNTQSPISDSSPESEKIERESDTDNENYGDVMPGSGLITWVKGAVSSGGILHRVAEKAKSSVDSMITTLDPQMKEYLKSGGDIYIVVASDKDVKVSPIREAFQGVFGKATIIGVPAQSEVTAEQPVGYAAAYAACKQRIAHVRSTHAGLTNNVPVVAVESYLVETVSDRWYDIALLVLSQPSLGIELQQVSQGTPVPAAAVAAARAATPPDYPHALTGLGVSVGSIMAASLQVPHTQWQEATTGVSRRELLTLASRAVAGAYKKLLAVSAAET